MKRCVRCLEAPQCVTCLCINILSLVCRTQAALSVFVLLRISSLGKPQTTATKLSRPQLCVSTCCWLPS